VLGEPLVKCGVAKLNRMTEIHVEKDFLCGLRFFLTAGSSKGGEFIIALLMEAVQTSETLVNLYQTTRRYNPEESHLKFFLFR
jgi:hypothetical protein